MPKGTRADGREHAGHRQRVKARFLQEGLEHFTPREILEIILFYAIPQGDVNPVADALLERFGSLNGVLTAGLQDLIRVPGVGDHTALLLHLFLPVFRHYHIAHMSAQPTLNSSAKAIEYAEACFIGCTRERFCMICMNNRSEVLQTVEFDQGTATEIAVPPRLLVEAALSSNATQVIFAHNHPGGICKPSLDDEIFTRRLMVTLTTLEVSVIDHLIFNGREFYSFFRDGRMDSLRNEVQIRVACPIATYTAE